ncbi:Tol-Pal system beta propeller repeat protein TolB [Steroidobacter cummioxidans]|uniref:Tol-Pal system beta propeller repeat protein TolB n=1 Tax=Steroidobacter cummioxidans TaxID=1803913 RepID=UPI000E31CDCC|nr:Tol-Pal system beta propeller repeat protein TolB [Steroidobacter cummioxidans]
MKKTFAVFVCFALTWLASAAHAQLVIEITKSAEDAVPIAIVPFGWESTGAAPFDVAEVVAADLRRSGRFAPLDRKEMIDRPVQGDQVRFQDWRYLKTDFIAVGKLMPEGAGFAAQFELYNVLTGQRLAGQRVTGNANNMRAVAHRISDIIFEQLTGVRGAFSTRVAFVSAEGTPPKQRYKLIVSDYDGENQQTITSSDEPIMSPAWSPDGQSLAYVSFETKASAIYVQTLRTGERKRVSARAGINGAPAWSPDGKTLAITLSRKDGDIDIYTLELNSQVLTRMTFDPGIDTEPSWSSDGKKLYFNSDRAGGPQIYEIEVANPNRATRVSFEGGYNARPRVSPDGKKLAVVTLDRGNYRIGVIDLASKGMQVLSEGRQDESPSFAPNGAVLIYATQDKGRGVLATVSTDGRTAERFSNTVGEVREPVWAPFPQR